MLIILLLSIPFFVSSLYFLTSFPLYTSFTPFLCILFILSYFSSSLYFLTFHPLYTSFLFILFIFPYFSSLTTAILYIYLHIFYIIYKGSKPAILMILNFFFCKVLKIFWCRYITYLQAWFQNRPTFIYTIILFFFYLEFHVYIL